MFQLTELLLHIIIFTRNLNWLKVDYLRPKKNMLLYRFSDRDLWSNEIAEKPWTGN